jgi:hypothetical protein
LRTIKFIGKFASSLLKLIANISLTCVVYHQLTSLIIFAPENLKKSEKRELNRIAIITIIKLEFYSSVAAKGSIHTTAAQFTHTRTFNASACTGARWTAS